MDNIWRSKCADLRTHGRDQALAQRFAVRLALRQRHVSIYALPLDLVLHAAQQGCPSKVLASLAHDRKDGMTDLSTTAVRPCYLTPLAPLSQEDTPTGRSASAVLMCWLLDCDCKALHRESQLQLQQL